MSATAAKQIHAGSYQWRGGEGTQTDLLADDWRSHDLIDDPRTPKNPDDTCCDLGDNVIAHERTRVSNGLVYMVNRFYEPETGRFTQADPMDFDPIQFIGGQNNRWAYATNDPVNFTDALGNWCVPATSPFALAFLAGSLLGGAYAAWALGDLMSITTAAKTALGAALLTKLFRQWLATLLVRSCAFETLNRMSTNPALWRAEAYGIAFLGGYNFGALSYAMWALFESGATWVG